MRCKRTMHINSGRPFLERTAIVAHRADAYRSDRSTIGPSRRAPASARRDGRPREPVCRRNPLGDASVALVNRRIASRMGNPASLIASHAGILQSHTGIRPQGEFLFLAVDPVFEPPQLRSGRRDEKMERRFVGQLALANVRFGRTNRRVSQCHSSPFRRHIGMPTFKKAPKKAPRFYRFSANASNLKRSTRQQN